MNLLQLLYLLFINHETKPVRLQKQKSLKDELKGFVDVNFNYIALALIIFLIIFFVWFCFFITGLSAVESGNYYYHLQEVI